MSEKILPCQQFGDPPFVNIVPDTLIKYTSITIILRGIVGTLKTFLYKSFVPVHKMPYKNSTISFNIKIIFYYLYIFSNLPILENLYDILIGDALLANMRGVFMTFKSG